MNTPKPILPFERDVTFLYARARAHWREERYAEALQLLHLALEREPGNPRLILAEARVLTLMGAYELSRRQAARLLAMNRHVDEALFLLGTSSYAMEQWMRAKSCLMQYVQRYPRGRHINMAEDLLAELHFRAHSHGWRRHEAAAFRALGHALRGNLAYAGQTLERLLRFAPQKPVTLALWGILTCYHGRDAEGLAHAKAAYESAPEDLLPLTAMALCMGVMGLPALAPQYLRRAADSATSLSESLLVIAACGKLGLHGLCRELLQALRLEHPEDLDVLHGLILACHNTGDLSQAGRLVAHLLLLDPADPIAAAMQQYLEETAREHRRSVLPLPYRWDFPIGHGSYLSHALPLLRKHLPGLAEAPGAEQSFLPVLRWGVFARQVSDKEIAVLTGLLCRLPLPPFRQLLRELLLTTHRSPFFKHRTLHQLAQMGEHGVVFCDERRNLLTCQIQRQAPKTSEAKGDPECC